MKPIFGLIIFVPAIVFGQIRTSFSLVLDVKQNGSLQEHVLLKRAKSDCLLEWKLSGHRVIERRLDDLVCDSIVRRYPFVVGQTKPLSNSRPTTGLWAEITQSPAGWFVYAKLSDYETCDEKNRCTQDDQTPIQQLAKAILGLAH